jgi:hypothetical protein
MPHSEPFVFNTERRLVVLTGQKARNLPELLAILKQISGSSIFYHTHEQYFLSQQFAKQEFYNDFALWISEALQEEALAEKLAAIDLLSFSSIREIRERMVAEMSAFLESTGGRARECPPGDEFHFCKSKSFVISTGIVARDLADFLNRLPSVSNDSLYFHFFEARLRLDRLTNDFSFWLSGIGETGMAEEISRLNPYAMTLDGLRNEIVEVGMQHLG